MPDLEIEVSIRRVLIHIFRRENKVPLNTTLSQEQIERVEKDLQILMLICNRAKEIGYSDSLQAANDEPVQEKPWVLESKEK